MSLDPALALPMAWFLAGLLALAAGHKLLRRDGFATTLEGYALVQQALLRPVTAAIAALEVATALALVIPKTMQIGALLAATLFGGYALAMILAILRGRAGIDCGCHFGERPEPLGWSTVGRNLALIAATGAVALPPSRLAAWPDILSGAIAGAASILILISARTALANRAAIRGLKGA